MATAGLFSSLGGDEASLQRQLDEQRAMKIAEMTGDQARGYLAASAGRDVGRGIAGLFGVDVTDPEVKAKALRARIASEIDYNDLNSVADGIRKLAQGGFAEEARQLATALETTKKTRAEAEAKLSEKLTPDVKTARELSSLKLKIDGLKRMDQADPAVKQALENFQAQYDALSGLTAKADKISPFGRLLTEAGIPEGSDQYKKLVKDFADATLASEKKGKGVTVTNYVGKDAGDIVSLRKDVQATTKPYQDQYDAATDAIDLASNAMTTNNFAAVATLSRSLAKAAGEQQLSGRDVQAFGADPSLVGGVADTLARLSKGRPTVDTLKQLKDLATILQSKAKNRLDLEEQQTRNVARASGNYTESQIDTIFPRRPKDSPPKTDFGSVADAEKAGLPKGTIITINGRKARVE